MFESNQRKKESERFIPFCSGTQNKYNYCESRELKEWNAVHVLFNCIHSELFSLSRISHVCEQEQKGPTPIFFKVVVIKLSYEAENHNQHWYDLNTQEKSLIWFPGPFPVMELLSYIFLAKRQTREADRKPSFSLHPAPGHCTSQSASSLKQQTWGDHSTECHYVPHFR